MLNGLGKENPLPTLLLLADRVAKNNRTGRHVSSQRKVCSVELLGRTVRSDTSFLGPSKSVLPRGEPQHLNSLSRNQKPPFSKVMERRTCATLSLDMFKDNGQICSQPKANTEYVMSHISVTPCIIDLTGPRPVTEPRPRVEPESPGSFSSFMEDSSTGYTTEHLRLLSRETTGIAIIMTCFVFGFTVYRSSWLYSHTTGESILQLILDYAVVNLVSLKN